MHTGKNPRPHPSILLRVCLAVLLAFVLAIPSCRKPVPAYTVVAAKEGNTHVVVRGETLESIARKYYGDPGLGKALGEYNGFDLNKPLEPGQTLIVPFD